MLNPFNLASGEAELFRDLERFRSEINRIFSNTLDRYPGGAPVPAGSFPVNVYTGDDELVLTAEIPGVAPDAVELTVENDLLTVAFERKDEPAGAGTTYHRRERAQGRFSRTLELPVRVNADKVEARADHGVLQVRLPRLEADKPRKISIQASR